MDDRKVSISSHDPGGRVGADAAPIAPCVRRPAGLEDKPVVSGRDQVERWPADAVPESSFVVYCGSAQHVSDGFAIALRAMAVGANLLLEDGAPPATSSNREDD
jgi:hypothetical protein